MTQTQPPQPGFGGYGAAQPPMGMPAGQAPYPAYGAPQPAAVTGQAPYPVYGAQQPSVPVAPYTQQPPPGYSATATAGAVTGAAGYAGASAIPLNVKIEVWKCNEKGEVHKRGPFVKRDSIMQVQRGETILNLISRLQDMATAPVGMKLEGPVLWVHPQGEQYAPILKQTFGHVTIDSVVNLQQPLLIVKTVSKPKAMFFGLFS